MYAPMRSASVRFNRAFCGLFFLIAIVLAALYEVRTYVVYIAPPPQDYLARLRESTVPGCVSFGLRKPSLLVVGDSHSFAGINFNEMSSELGTEDIGACALAGMRMASWRMLIDRIERDKAAPKVIIYGASPLHYSPGISHYDEQLGQHQDVLRGRATDQVWRIDFGAGPRWLLAYLSERLLHSPPEGGEVQQRTALEKHTPRIEGLSEDRAQELTRTFKHHSRRLFETEVSAEAVTRNPDVDRMIDEVCEFVRSNNITLYVWTTPENPFTDSFYTPGQKALYHDYIERYRPCAKAIVYGKASDYGLGYRHYLNRKMLDDFPYRYFDASQSMPTLSTLEALPDLEQRNLYDTDHVNLVGATRLTRVLVPKLQTEGINEALRRKP